MSKLIWDMFTNIVYVVNYFMILYTIAFEIAPLKNFWVFEFLIDLIQLMDIMTEFITTKYNNDGVLLESIQ